jgi:hypothetical protein
MDETAHAAYVFCRAPIVSPIPAAAAVMADERTTDTINTGQSDLGLV